MNQWIEENCPECKASNFVNNGDPEDLTRPDIEGIECHACGHKWAIVEESELELMYGEDYAEALGFTKGRSLAGRG